MGVEVGGDALFPNYFGDDLLLLFGHTDRHAQQTDNATWTTKLVGNSSIASKTRSINEDGLKVYTYVRSNKCIGPRTEGMNRMLATSGHRSIVIACLHASSALTLRHVRIAL